MRIVQTHICLNFFFHFAKGTEWNVQIISAPQVWQQGTDGAGVVVLGKISY